MAIGHFKGGKGDGKRGNGEWVGILLQNWIKQQVYLAL